LGPAMRAALASGTTDMIGLARPFALEPDLPMRLLREPRHASQCPHPTTGVAFIDKMAMLSITWYESQLDRIAKGKRPDPGLNAWRVVAGTFGRLGAHAFSKRRASPGDR